MSFPSLIIFRSCVASPCLMICSRVASYCRLLTPQTALALPSLLPHVGRANLVRVLGHFVPENTVRSSLARFSRAEEVRKNSRYPGFPFGARWPEPEGTSPGGAGRQRARDEACETRRVSLTCDRGSQASQRSEKRNRLGRVWLMRCGGGLRC